jgi:hypothetical protein
MKTASSFWIAGLVALALSACGGGGSDSPGTGTGTPAATESVPASASGSVSGFIDYLQGLVKAAADALEPVSVANVTPATSETDEPRKLD